MTLITSDISFTKQTVSGVEINLLLLFICFFFSKELQEMECHMLSLGYAGANKLENWELLSLNVITY